MRRRAKTLALYLGATVTLVLVGLAILGDATGNHGLWTLGGTVGMARGTQVAIGLLALCILILARILDNGNGPQPPSTGGYPQA